jgi:hypothetical protein
MVEWEERESDDGKTRKSSFDLDSSTLNDPKADRLFFSHTNFCSPSCFPRAPICNNRVQTKKGYQSELLLYVGIWLSAIQTSERRSHASDAMRPPSRSEERRAIC